MFAPEDQLPRYRYFCIVYKKKSNSCELISVHQAGFEDPQDYKALQQYHLQQAKENCPLTLAVTGYRAYPAVQWMMQFINEQGKQHGTQ